MYTPDLPVELWLEILTYLPRSALHKMIGVNRVLFELALDDLYEEVRFISDDRDMRKVFAQLSNHPGIARRVRRLFIRPAFLPAVDDSTEVKSTFRAIINAKTKVTGGIFDLATRAAKSCPNLGQISLIIHDHAIVPEFEKFLGTIWAHAPITRVIIDTTIVKVPVLLQPLDKLNNLTEFDITISVSRFPATLTECHLASRALLATMTTFKDNITALTFSSLVPMELEDLFESLPRLLKLKKFEFLVIFNVETIPNTEGLTKFVARHSPTLETLILRPHGRQVSLAIPDHTYNIWLDHKPLQKSSRVYSLTQVSLPNLRIFDVGLREPSSTTSGLPPIARFAPSLTTLVISNPKLLHSQLVVLLQGAVKSNGNCSLEDLSFGILKLTSAVFDLLSKAAPNLKRLAIGYDFVAPDSTQVPFLNLPERSRQFVNEMQARRYPEWKLERLRLSGHPTWENLQYSDAFTMAQVAQCFLQPVIQEND